MSHIHPQFRKADGLSRQAIGAPIEVHRLKGPGLFINFHELKLRDGAVAKVLPGTNRDSGVS
jgi:hypothetical protein